MVIRFISQLTNMYITLPDQLGIYRPMGRRNNDVNVIEKGRALTATQLTTATFSDAVHDISLYLWNVQPFPSLFLPRLISSFNSHKNVMQKNKLKENT